MKTYLFVFAALLLASCHQQEPQTSEIPQTTIVSGRIDNYQQQAIKLISDEFIGQRQYDAVWDQEGNFTFSFPMWNAHNINFWFDSEPIPLFLHPGDSIYFTADANHLHSTLSFSGDADESTACLSAFMLEVGDIQQSEDVFLQMKKLSPSQFKAFIASFRNKGDSLVNHLMKTFNADKETSDWMHNYIAYRCMELLYEYGDDHDLTQQNDELYYNFIHDYPLNETIALQCSQYYQDIIDEQLKYQTRTSAGYQKLLLTAQEEGLGSFLSGFIDNIKPEGVSVAEQIQLTKVFGFVIEQDFRVVDSLREAFDNVVALPALKGQLSYALEEAKYRDANKVTLQQLADNEKIAPIFKEIQSKHGGKVLYIDCWTTWCGPCIKEFPNSVVLHDQLKEEDIEFIYFCLGNDQSKWQNLLDKHQLMGSHFYLDEVQRTELERIFRIKGVPRYLIIDKKGVVIKDYADRPGSATTKNELMALVRK